MAAPAAPDYSPEASSPPEHLSPVQVPAEIATPSEGASTEPATETQSTAIADGAVLDRPGIAAPDVKQIPAPDDVSTLERVMRFLATYPAPECFVALPGLTETGGFRFEVFARDPVTIANFRGALEAEVGLLPNTRMVPITAAQCRALDFLRLTPAYPSFRAFIVLESHALESGGQLKGRIGNLGAGVIGLYIVDDEGVVQDLGGYLNFSRRGVEFSIPMVLRGAPVETFQLLVAVVTPTRPDTTAAQALASGRGTTVLASEFFAQMGAEFRRRGFREDLAVVAFSVR